MCPISRGCVWGIHEVGKEVEGKFGEVNGRDVLGCFGVSSVELGHKSLHASDIFRWSQFILLYAVPFPAYEVFKFPLEDSAV